MAKADKKPALYLFLDTDTPKNSGYGSGYEGHVYLRPVRLKQGSFGGVIPDFPSNYGDDRGLYDLYMVAGIQADRATVAHPVWYMKVGYEDHSSRDYPVELAEVELRAKMLRRLETGYEKMRASLGYPKSFGQYCAWYASALNAKGVIERSEYADTKFTLASFGIAETIDYAVDRQARAVRKAAGKVADLPLVEEATA